jgi:polyhydroxyalkanoate synthesis repressor PhaR
MHAAMQHNCVSGILYASQTNIAVPHAMAKADKTDPIIIKKYANRRLYNTSTSKYVTLDDLSQMVKAGTEFQVVDAKSGDNITRSVLTQIIFEEESKGQNLLPISFLRQLIQFYGDSLQTMVPNYLEASMDAFSNNQERMRDYMQGAVGNPMNPFAQWEEMGRQNMAMFERAFQMFTPQGAGGSDGSGSEADAPAASTDDDSKLDDLKTQIENLRRQLDEMAR